MRSPASWTPPAGSYMKLLWPKRWPIRRLTTSDCPGREPRRWFRTGVGLFGPVGGRRGQTVGGDPHGKRVQYSVSAQLADGAEATRTAQHSAYRQGKHWQRGMPYSLQIRDVLYPAEGIKQPRTPITIPFSRETFFHNPEISHLIIQHPPGPFLHMKDPQVTWDTRFRKGGHIWDYKKEKETIRQRSSHCSAGTGKTSAASAQTRRTPQSANLRQGCPLSIPVASWSTVHVVTGKMLAGILRDFGHQLNCGRHP